MRNVKSERKQNKNQKAKSKREDAFISKNGRSVDSSLGRWDREGQLRCAPVVLMLLLLVVVFWMKESFKCWRLRKLIWKSLQKPVV